jgi:uncharacterized ferredoxin-like protein
MKTKTTRQDRTCYTCEAEIQKGSQYANKSILIGYTATWGHSKDCKCCGGVCPTIEERPSVWQPYRTTMPICATCANS